VTESLLHHASFRDPSGFLFRRSGRLYRQVNQVYAPDYEHLMSSGLYEKLVENGRMIPHREVEVEPADPARVYKIVEPDRVPFISYPYEWSFGMLREAALATLAIQKRALKAGMTLKDSSAYNIQFVCGKAALIDTLSFEIYRPGEPWIAYRQFCQHFLAPLALMAHVDIRLGQLLRVYIDGVPLDLASRMLPFRTRLDMGLLTHIHVHARVQKHYAGKDVSQDERRAGMKEQSLIGLIDSLESSVRKLRWNPGGTEWSGYYDSTNYSDAAFEYKKNLVTGWSLRIKPQLVWDLGANTGVFSRAACQGEPFVVSWDIDPGAVERNYLQMKKVKEQNILPLVLDLTNPSPAIGWHNRERDSFSDRAPADLLLALALIHHLAISNNVPLPQLADFFSDVSRWLVIEFVPKSDSQVQKLLRSRKDIFDHYTQEEFERAFARHFKIHEKQPVSDSERVLYLMERC
jgi:ribosomal protein L11 methylase PrmA